MPCTRDDLKHPTPKLSDDVGIGQRSETADGRLLIVQEWL